MKTKLSPTRSFVILVLFTLFSAMSAHAQESDYFGEKKTRFVISAGFGGSIPTGAYGAQNTNTDGHAVLGYNAKLSFLYVSNSNVGIGATFGAFDNGQSLGTSELNTYYLLTPSYTFRHNKLKVDVKSMFGFVGMSKIHQEGHLNSTLLTTYETTRQATSGAGVGAGIDLRAEIIPAIDMFFGVDYIYTSVRQYTTVSNSSTGFGYSYTAPISIININWGVSYDW